jgi:hypothetical protein
MKTKILIPLITLACLLATPAMAQVNYSVSGGTARVTYSPKASGDIVIASTYSGFPVTRIEVWAFLDCTNLTSVTIPNSVTNIGGNAFYDCTALTNIAVAMDNPSYSSPDGALFNKAQTTLIQFPCGRDGGYAVPSGVTSIGAAAFYHCTGLTNVTIPNTVVSIGLEAFSGCTGLTGATIPDSVTAIQGSAFYGTALTSVTIPNSVTNLQYGAFAHCTSLTNIIVSAANPAYSSPNGVLFNKAQTTLFQFPGGRGGGYAIPNGVTGFGSAFSACPNLTSVTIPNTVVSIEVRAFYACYSLTSVTMGGSITWIRDEVFSGCTNLTSVTIPNSVTGIGAYPFYGCASLTNITVDAANSVCSSVNGVLLDKAQTTLMQFPPGLGGDYVIPGSVTSIGLLAFYGCASLRSITIPDSVTYIDFSAFYYCRSLTNLTFLGNAPALNGTVFYGLAVGARGYYSYGASGWGPTLGGLPTMMLGAPAPQLATGTASVKPGGFDFTITGVANQTIVIEASTNLANWQPIWTNTLAAVSTNFVDPQWVNYPRRFYRLRSN